MEGITIPLKSQDPSMVEPLSLDTQDSVVVRTFTQIVLVPQQCLFLGETNIRRYGIYRLVTSPLDYRNILHEVDFEELLATLTDSKCCHWTADWAP